VHFRTLPVLIKTLPVPSGVVSALIFTLVLAAIVVELVCDSKVAAPPRADHSIDEEELPMNIAPEVREKLPVLEMPCVEPVKFIVPTSESVTLEFCISSPEVPSKRTRALSVEEAAPSTAPSTDETGIEP